MNSAFGKPSGTLRWLDHRAEYDVVQLLSFAYSAIDLAAAYGSGAASGWQFDLERYQALIPGELQDWNQQVAKLNRRPLHYTEYPLFLSPILDERFVPFHLATVGWVRKWLQAELAVNWRDKHIDSQLFSHPDRLITAGYQLLPQPGSREPLDSSEGAAGLGLVGLGAIWYWYRERCEICFRLQSPGLFRCSLHSQSKNNLGDDPHDAARRAHSSRIARKAIAAYGDLSKILRTGFWGTCHFEHTIAYILWPSLAVQASYSTDKVKAALDVAPHVRRLLPTNFPSVSPVEQMSALRENLDPEERVANIWPDKIREAEEWLAAEAIVAPGRRSGLSPSNVARVAQIAHLLEQGLSKSEIAAQLDISTSHLSHLLRRAQARRGKP